MRADSVYGVKSYDKILFPTANNLKIHRRQFPQTLIYMKLKYCAYAYKLFKNIIENNMFHASQTDSMKQEIMK